MQNDKDKLLEVLSQHIGKERGVGVKRLAAQLNMPERRVRKLVSDVRKDGTAVCGHPSTGYYVATTPEELNQTLDFLKDRALHSLKLASVLGKLPLADLIGQLHLRT